ncbi:recombinase family protein [Methylobacterium brachiatum]|nr:recombinase family protein [Methylobacterium brachiatum]
MRFSRPEQMRGDSLRRQVAKANAWAEKRGLVIDETLKDLGVSAFRGANRIKGALGVFHSLVEKGEVPRGSYLIIESLDRFSRKAAREVLPDFLGLINEGIIVVTLIDKQEYSAKRIDDEPMALFGSLMVMQRAHEESKTKAERLSEAWTEKRSQAAGSGRVMTARVPAWLRVVEADGRRRMEFRPATADCPDGRELVRRIFTEAIRGYGRRTIATRLNDAKIPPLQGGKEWHPSYILKVLQSRAAYSEHQSYRFDEAGKRVPTGEPIRDYYPAAVTEAEFIRANGARENRKPAAGGRGPTGVVNLMRGIAYCSCGNRMARVCKGDPKKGAPYLVCADAKRGTCENTRRWPVAWAEDRLLGTTARIDVGKVLATANATEGRRSGPTIADLEGKVADLGTRLLNIMGLVEQGVEEFAGRALVLRREKKDAEAELSAMRRMGARRAYEPSPEQRRALMADLRARLAAATPEERADLRTRLAQEVRGAFDRVTFDPHRITVTYKGVVPHGQGVTTQTVTVAVFSDHPEEMAMLALFELDDDRRPDKPVSGVGRWRAARRPARVVEPSPDPEWEVDEDEPVMDAPRPR